MKNFANEYLTQSIIHPKVTFFFYYVIICISMITKMMNVLPAAKESDNIPVFREMLIKNLEKVTY